MASGQLLSDELILPDLLVSTSHPMDSSRILLGLMSLSRQTEAPVASSADDLLEGVISRGVLRSLLSALHFRDVATVRHARRTARLAVERPSGEIMRERGAVGESSDFRRTAGISERALDDSTWFRNAITSFHPIAMPVLRAVKLSAYSLR